MLNNSTLVFLYILSAVLVGLEFIPRVRANVSSWFARGLDLRGGAAYNGAVLCWSEFFLLAKKRIFRILLLIFFYVVLGDASITYVWYSMFSVLLHAASVVCFCIAVIDCFFLFLKILEVVCWTFGCSFCKVSGLIFSVALSRASAFIGISIFVITTSFLIFDVTHRA